MRGGGAPPALSPPGVGAPGGGGEYECAEGFGWTNGVALIFLERYGWRGGGGQRDAEARAPMPS